MEPQQIFILQRLIGLVQSKITYLKDRSTLKKRLPISLRIASHISFFNLFDQDHLLGGGIASTI